MKKCDLRNIKFDPSCKLTTKINETQVKGWKHTMGELIFTKKGDV
jgi:hypothetical protein